MITQDKSPRFIFIDGPDRSGKSTLISPLAKRINYSSIIVDRGPLGFVAYDKTFRNTWSDDKYWKRDILDDSMTVLLTTSPEIALMRALQCGEVCTLSDCNLQKIIFDSYLKLFVERIKILHSNHVVLVLDSNVNQVALIDEIEKVIEQFYAGRF